MLVFSACSINSEDQEGPETEEPNPLPPWAQELPQTDTYNGEPVAVITGMGGAVSLHSDTFDVDYSITIENDGVPLQGYVIEYTESDNKSVLHGYDPLGNYSPFVISGTPDYVQEYFSDVESENRFLILGTIALVVTVVLVAKAELDFIQSVARIQQFYYENAVDYYDGGLVLQTTFDELADDFIVQRFLGTMALVDIGMSFITAGAGNFGDVGVYTFVLDMGANAGNVAATELRNKLVEKAIVEWGITTQQALDSDIYVVVDLDSEDNGFEKMYASYKVYLENPAADLIFLDSFEDCSYGDDPSPSYWDLTESGTSDIYAIYGDATDGNVSIEFNDGVSDDYCYMVGGLGGITDGWITWDWKVKNPGSFGFQAWSEDYSYTWDNVNFYVSFRSDGSLCYNYSNSYNEETIFQYDEDEWYHMRLYFDCATDTVDLYVNGVKRLRQHEFWHAADGIDYFRFIAFSNTSINGAVIDNIRVTSNSGLPAANSGVLKNGNTADGSDNSQGCND